MTDRELEAMCRSNTEGWDSIDYNGELWVARGMLRVLQLNDDNINRIFGAELKFFPEGNDFYIKASTVLAVLKDALRVYKGELSSAPAAQKQSLRDFVGLLTASIGAFQDMLVAYYKGEG